MSDFALAAVLGGAILVASTISVEIGLSVALIELTAGVIVGNAFHPDLPDWLSFIGSFAGIVLTFLAGAEVDVPQFKREWRASVSIGAVSFFAPSLADGASAYWALGWNLKQSEIAGIALSTTSLAVVYAVLVETGLDRAALVPTPPRARAYPPPTGGGVLAGGRRRRTVLARRLGRDRTPALQLPQADRGG